MSDNGDVWAKVKHTLDEMGLEHTPEGIAQALNEAAGEVRYTGRYILAVREGRAPVSPDFFKDAIEAFDLDDATVVTMYQSFFHIGARSLGMDAPPIYPVQVELLVRETPSVV